MRIYIKDKTCIALTDRENSTDQSFLYIQIYKSTNLLILRPTRPMKCNFVLCNTNGGNSIVFLSTRCYILVRFFVVVAWLLKEVFINTHNKNWNRIVLHSNVRLFTFCRFLVLFRTRLHVSNKIPKKIESQRINAKYIYRIFTIINYGYRDGLL